MIGDTDFEGDVDRRRLVISAPNLQQERLMTTQSALDLIAEGRERVADVEGELGWTGLSKILDLLTYENLGDVANSIRLMKAAGFNREYIEYALNRVFE